MQAQAVTISDNYVTEICPKVSGWILTHEANRTVVRVETGEIFYANRDHKNRDQKLKLDRQLAFGTPVVCAVMYRGRNDGYLYGEIVEFSPLPEIKLGVSRPLALIDAANISSNLGGDMNVRYGWHFGAVKTWALAWGLDAAGYEPFFVCDPNFRQTCWENHAPSDWAMFNANSRWRCMTYQFDNEKEQNADRAILEMAEANPDAIVLTTDRFVEHRAEHPWLATPEGKARIFLGDGDTSERRLHLRGRYIDVPDLDIHVKIPLPLFTFN